MCTERPLSKFQPGAPHNLNPPLGPGPWWLCATLLLQHPSQSQQTTSRVRRVMSTTILGVVDGLDFERQHTPRFVLLRNTHELQRRSRPIWVSRSGKVRQRCGCSWAGPTLFLEGSFQEGGCRCRKCKCGVLRGCTYPTTPHSIGDPPSAPRVSYYCQLNWLNCCAAKTNGCLNLRRRAFALG